MDKVNDEEEAEERRCCLLFLRVIISFICVLIPVIMLQRAKRTHTIRYPLHGAKNLLLLCMSTSTTPTFAALPLLTNSPGPSNFGETEFLTVTYKYSFIPVRELLFSTNRRR